ncbi:splicing factor, proline- and glutamine-rich-like [Mirounga angustirostris]|uniref:splicing factor, proline- and glutamine-rich-like n=1 Tax=Mirounga angustirostris TaxID=9716 RepID=UPI00313E5175
MTPYKLSLWSGSGSGSGIGGKGPEAATSLHPGGEEAGGCRSAGAGRRDGSGGQGTAVPSPKRDANQQSWEKVNKGHAPCRRPAGAHPPLRPQPVHFHSPSASPPPDSRAAPEGGYPQPQPPPRTPGLHTRHTHLERVSPAPPKHCLICAEPPRRGAEHAAPACSARVHPAQRGGDRAEAVAPGRCLGPDRLHVSPARSHVHRLSPVRRPDVLRINKMKLRATGGQIGPGPLNPHPRQNDLPSTAVSRRSPSARPEPAGQVAALARPRPPAPPHRPGGALPQSLIKKVAKLTLPKVVVACAPLSLPAMYSLKHD